MKNRMLLIVSVAAGLSLASLQAAWAQKINVVDPPFVFQAAGPTIESIQGIIEQFRAALGEPNNANAVGPILAGRREINWDGGGATNTTDPVTPFDVFLNTRGAQFTTLGKGLSQATPDGLATLFNNPDYQDIFAAFSPERLFTPVGSNVTEARFFVPGTSGKTAATVKGFGAVFIDVDQPNGTGAAKPGTSRGSTLLEYFGAEGRRLFSGSAPSSPGDATFSFFGIVFDDAPIARVRITTGTVAPGPDDSQKRDIVVMDDFFTVNHSRSVAALLLSSDKTNNG